MIGPPAMATAKIRKITSSCFGVNRMDQPVLGLPVSGSGEACRTRAAPVDAGCAACACDEAGRRRAL
jgi:hypothetical protein